MASELQQAIRRTHAWFSLFEYPLTSFETWKWLDAGLMGAEAGGPRRPERSHRSPGRSEDDGVGRSGGPMSLCDVMGAMPETNLSETVIAERQIRYCDAMRKMKKLRRAVWYLSRIPGVAGIYAVNTLAFWHTRGESDIDLLIRVAPGSVWTARLLCVLPFAILKQRPEDGKRDPFCFSFFADTDADLASVALPEGDPYLSVWLRSMVPVFKTSEASSVPKFVEAFARRFQMRLFPKAILDRMNKDTSVIVNDSMLKFHDTDRRAEYRDKWRALCNELDCVA